MRDERLAESRYLDKDAPSGRTRRGIDFVRCTGRRARRHVEISEAASSSWDGATVPRYESNPFSLPIRNAASATESPCKTRLQILATQINIPPLGRHRDARTKRMERRT
jgi:hypothetical protein